MELSVFNVLGQKVATLFSGPRMAGMHDAVWSPNTAGGIYFVTLKTAATMQTRKVLYLR
ncbi:MAG: T9SS type A sorting domain-containing protein [Calditrichota bacterium]